MYTILICDDEIKIRETLYDYFTAKGYSVSVAENGKTGAKKTEDEDFDLILLDVMMPNIDGFEVCKKLRTMNNNIGIIMLTAKTQEMDKITGLMIGADDYVTKPFNILELKARIKAILRRSVKKAAAVPEAKNALKARDLELSFDSRRVFVSGKEVNLTAKEFDLLELLMENPGKVYSREKLLDTIWGFDYPGDVRTVDVHVRRLREKIEANPSEPKYIFTKWGVGYYFNEA